MSLNDTPRADRLHIALFGKRNSGKSSLINALTGQNISLVSEHAGTTTDPVFKAMELHPVGPVVFIDTAGFDDEGQLGALRVEKTKEVIDRTDIALLIFGKGDWEQEKEWKKLLDEKRIPVIPLIGKTDEIEDVSALSQKLESELGEKLIPISAQDGRGLEEVRHAIEKAVPEDFQRRRILGDLVSPGELVLLVMPQDIQAPKGRLILPQVQTIRELLDSRCTTVCTTAERFSQALVHLKEAPSLIITDSQCFKQIYEQKPQESRLTSFSVLFAAYKGDIHTFAAGAQAIDSLTENSRVLIAEACTHAPLEEDIGRVKIPAMLRKKKGEGLQIDFAAGSDFPEHLEDYDLVIHCGACMFNRRHVMSRVEKAQKDAVPITNYGIAMAKLSGILDKIKLPE